MHWEKARLEGGMVKAPWVQYLPTCRDNRDLSLHQHHHCYHHRRYHQQQQTVVIPDFRLPCVMTVVMFGVIKSGIRRTDKESVLTCSGVNFKISLVSHSQFVKPSTEEVFAKKLLCCLFAMET